MSQSYRVFRLAMKGTEMHKKIMPLLQLLVLVAICPAVLAQTAQTKKPAPPKQPSASKQPAATQLPATEAEKKNIQAYIELLRTNVRQEKSQLMGEVMLLDVDDAKKFWPIYSDYNDELSKVNNMRSDNIQEYARTYTSMTDEKADELIKRALDYQKQRSELLGKYYERFKQELGAITAARFVQVENQLLLIIDLQIASSLPIVGQQ
jgi:hypothetical protein